MKTTTTPTTTNKVYELLDGFFTEIEGTHVELDHSDGNGYGLFSPGEWAAKGEEYGTHSLLVIMHDSGHGDFFNGQYPPLTKALDELLHKHGVYAEQCTGWYSAIYPIPTH